MKTGVLIPAYNEESQIGEVVRAVRAKGFAPVVIDDGSDDGTCEAAKSAGAAVIRHEKNLGKGASLRTGIKHILSEGYEAVLIMDGDGQHSADDIQKFTGAGNRRINIMVIGNRMDRTQKMPFDRKVTNMFMSFIISLICGQKIPDSQCGFRLLKRELLEKIKIVSYRFEIESELLVKASRAGARILSVPIQTLYGKETSRINPLRDSWRFIIFLVKLPFMR